MAGRWRLRPIVPTVVALLLVLSLAGRVLAADIPRLDGPVTDRTGALAGEANEIESAIDTLLDEAGVQLFVVFVPTTDELTAPEFASQTAMSNSLGADDALLLVAIEERTDAIWVAEGLDAITDAEIDDIIASQLEPRLRDGDFGGAVLATAEGLGAAATTAAPTEPPAATQGPAVTPAPGAGSVSDDSGSGVAGILLLVAGVVVVMVVGFRWLGSRLTARREAEERDRRTGRLAREANALLVQTDERIRTAQQEIGYIEAAYGAAETEPLRTAVGEAQTELHAAFEVRQRLDDAEPEDPPTREAMLGEIVTRTQKAQAALDREADRIRQLRDLERDAPTVLNEIVPKIDAIEGRLSAAQAALAELVSDAPAAVAPVRGNLEEAQKGLSGARAAVDAGIAALQRDDRRAAAKRARTAIVGVDGASVLVEAIEKLAATVRESRARLPQELEAARAGVAEARAMLERPDTTDRPAEMGTAEDALRAAAAAASGGDPVTAIRSATEAHRSADAAVAALRQAALERSRLIATADASLATAEADILLAADYIAARRTGVGRTARTRLAEAERHLAAAAALRDADPEQAIAAARRAEQLAEQAYSLADRDFTDWNGGGPGGTGLPPRGGGSDALGAILGGILGGVLSGGGRGGGWGGSPWGSQGPLGGSGWGGGRGGGGFGGPFGGGGGFGGGGRSRGGRW